jgi:hypothetical protein
MSLLRKLTRYIVFATAFALSVLTGCDNEKTEDDYEHIYLSDAKGEIKPGLMVSALCKESSSIIRRRVEFLGSVSKLPLNQIKIKFKKTNPCGNEKLEDIEIGFYDCDYEIIYKKKDDIEKSIKGSLKATEETYKNKSSDDLVKHGFELAKNSFVFIPESKSSPNNIYEYFIVIPQAKAL